MAEFLKRRTYIFPLNMKTHFYSLLFLTASDAVAQTTDTTWKHAVIASLNLSQVSFTHWSQGGTNTLSYLAGINGKSVREDDVTNLTNTYKLNSGHEVLTSKRSARPMMRSISNRC